MATVSGSEVDNPNKLESIGKALGRITSGVYIITLERSGQRQGLLATWINQASFQPPTLTIAVNKERPALKELTAGSDFTINIISKNNMDVFKAFAKPAQTAEERFDGLKMQQSCSCGPIFSEAVAYLDCRVASSMDAGDHVVLLAEVIGGAMLNADDQPMNHLRQNGFQY